MGREQVNYRLQLLGGFQLLHGDRSLRVSRAAQRVLAFLALSPRPADSTFVGERLWIDSDSVQAAGNLRSAVWRLRRQAGPVIERTGAVLRIAGEVAVDVDEASQVAAAVIRGDGAVAPDPLARMLSAELLPGWYEDWVLMERERVRQRSLHGLEAGATRLLDVGDHAGAIDLALASVQIEPLRETPYRLLVSAHDAEGNHSEALRAYRRYAELLHDELGAAPSAELQAQVHGLERARGAA